MILRFRWSRVRAAAALLALAAAALASAGCASDDSSAVARQPYKVVLLPVEGAARALSSAEKRSEDFVSLALTPDEMQAAVFEGIRKSNAFSELVVQPPESVAAGKASGDPLGAAAAFARTVNADLLLRVTVKSAEMRDLGNNGSTVVSSFMWFMLPLPTWFADDRTYDTNLAVAAELYEPRDTVKPTATVAASSGQEELDLWDRGLSPWVPIIPPPFLKGSDKTVSETLTERAMTKLMDNLVTDLRTREIPSRFELVLDASAPGALRIRVTSGRALRSLEVFVGGKRSESWLETSLAPDAGGSKDGFVYTRSAKVPAKPAQPVEVRVVAEDEAGAREVRTVVLGRTE